MEINKRIEKAKKIIQKAYKDIPVGKKEVANLTIDKLAFIAINIEDLENDIKENGAVELYDNGNQLIRRSNPAQKLLTDMLSRWSALSKTLNELFPADEVKVDVNSYEDMMENFSGKSKAKAKGKKIEKR